MGTLRLVRPCETYIEEVRAFKEEFLAHDSHSHGTNGLDGFADIHAWLTHCRLHNKVETIPPDSRRVPSDQYLLVRGNEKYIIGMINFRHTLGADGSYLSEHGGHIGFGIRPAERGQGYAKAMLQLCLEKCRAFGLDKVLITCAPDNEKSRRTIIACGGQFERVAITGDETDERYWITLGVDNK